MTNDFSFHPFSGLNPADPRELRFRRLLLYVSAAALLLRLAAALPALIHPELTLRPDSTSYLEGAYALLNNGSFGDWTARPPLYPALLAVLAVFHHEVNLLMPLAGCLLSALTCWPAGWCGRLLFGRKAGIFTAVLLAGTLTAVANAPLLLADALLGFLCAWQTCFLIQFIRTRSLGAFALACAFTAAGALTKPVNLPVYLAGLPFLALVMFGRDRRTVFAWAIAAALFGALLMPWMLQVRQAGAGFNLDSNNGLTALHMTSAVESLATGTPSESIRTRIRAEANQAFAAQPDKFSSDGEQNRFFVQYLIRTAGQYPLSALRAQLVQPYILLPDLPSFLENNGLSRSGQGTLDVLRERGLYAAVHHYLGGRLVLLILPLPFLLVTALVYAGAAGMLWFWLKHGKWRLLALFSVLVLYYLIAPGPVTMPRYQIPALPLLCTMSAGFLCLFPPAKSAFRKVFAFFSRFRR